MVGLAAVAAVLFFTGVGGGRVVLLLWFGGCAAMMLLMMRGMSGTQQDMHGGQQPARIRDEVGAIPHADSDPLGPLDPGHR